MGMRILAIDTCNTCGSLAALEDGRVKAVVSADSPEAYSSRLFRQLDYLLAHTALKLGDFDAFAVASGPGSFTGVRIGLTAVKGWAEVLGKPVVAVGVLEAVAAQAPSGAERIAAMVDARRGQVFSGLYQQHDGTLARILDDSVETLQEFLARLPADGVRPAFVSTTPQAFADGLANSRFAQCRLTAASPVLAPVVVRLAYARAQRGEFTDALHLDANYVRRSDAELLWKGV